MRPITLVLATTIAACGCAVTSNQPSDTVQGDSEEVPGTPSTDSVGDTDPTNAPATCSFHLRCDAVSFSAGATLPPLEALAAIDRSGHIVWRLVDVDQADEDGGWQPMRHNADGSQAWIESWTAPAEPGQYLLQVRAAADPGGTTGWTTCEARGLLETDGSSTSCGAPDSPPHEFDVDTMRLLVVEGA